MSYSCYDGVIDFNTKKDFDKFLEDMKSSGQYDHEWDSWINDDGIMRKNAESVFDDPPVVLQGDGVYAVILPNYPLDNFWRLIRNCLKPNTWTGEIRATTDDGEFEGYILHPDGEWETFDLESWAKEHGHELNRDEDDEDWDTGDRCDVMEAFIENPKPPKNSTKFILAEGA